MRESEARAERVLESIGDAVIVTDKDSRVTRMNGAAASLTGWTGTEAEGQQLQTVFRSVNEKTRLRIENPAAGARQLDVSDSLAAHGILIARDGTERFIEDKGAMIRGADGEVEGVVLVFRDISERRQAE